MASLVIAEQRQGMIKAATWASLAAARQLEQSISVLVIGYQCYTAAQQVACYPGVVKVYWIDNPVYAHPAATQISEIVVCLATHFTHIIAAATSFGKEVMPRVAAALDVAQISEVSAIIADDVFSRAIYTGSAIATVQALDPIKVLTIRHVAFATQFEKQDLLAEIESLDIVIEKPDCIWVEEQFNPNSRPELAAANIIITGGRGLQKAENFKMLEALADSLQAGLGATRAAVDAGFISNDYQIGQTGKVVAPDLYVAVGVSGAIQHLAGMRESKVIVAINKDPDAPIFQIADYVWVTDLLVAIPALLDALKGSAWQKSV